MVGNFQKKCSCFYKRQVSAVLSISSGIFFHVHNCKGSVSYFFFCLYSPFNVIFQDVFSFLIVVFLWNSFMTDTLQKWHFFYSLSIFVLMIPLMVITEMEKETGCQQVWDLCHLSRFSSPALSLKLPGVRYYENTTMKYIWIKKTGKKEIHISPCFWFEGEILEAVSSSSSFLLFWYPSSCIFSNKWIAFPALLNFRGI